MDILQLQHHLNQRISELPYGTDPPELYEPIRYLMNLGGKRMRPLLCLLSYSIFKNDPEKIIDPSLGIEVFHNFTLMHDDIMDKAPLRRGNPTVHQKWNDNIAILSGDVMLVFAYELLLRTEDHFTRKILYHFNRCAAEVCEGQQLDMNYENNETISETQYIEMIRRKTAVLLGFSLQMGGILAEASDRLSDSLRKQGENIGIGFQLKDDLLDVYGDAGKFGKQVGGDIIANKKTFLLIKALEIANRDQKEVLTFWLNCKEFDPTEKVKAVTEVYDQLSIRKLTENKISGFFEKGIKQLRELEVDKRRKEPLENFIFRLIERES